MNLSLKRLVLKTFWLSFAWIKNITGPSTARRPSFGQTAYGVKMVQRWHDRTFVYCHGGIYGTYLADKLKRQTSPFTFLDIGANQGLYSLIAAQNPACVHVYSFEPVLETFKTLNENIELNNLAQKISSIRKAISSKSGEIAIHVPNGHSGMATLERNGNDAEFSGTTEVIETIAAAELEVLLANSDALLVKIDVEGHELTVLNQLLACEAAKKIEGVFYEVDTRWSDSASIKELLSIGGFSKFEKIGSGKHFDVMALR